MKLEDIQPEIGHTTYYALGIALVVVGMAISGFSNHEAFALISIGLGALLVILGAHWQKYVTLRSVVLYQRRQIDGLHERIEKLELDTEQRIRALELAKIRLDAKVFPGEPSKYFDDNMFPEVKPPKYYDNRGKLVPQHESLDR